MRPSKRRAIARACDCALKAEVLPNMATNNSLAFEIKPKWLKRSAGQAQTLHQELKRDVCRFCMHQKLKLSQGFVKKIRYILKYNVFFFKKKNKDKKNRFQKFNFGSKKNVQIFCSITKMFKKN